MNKPGSSQDKIISKIEEEFRRHTNVLREDFERQVKTIGKQHGSVMKKLDEHDGRFAKIDDRLRQHDLEFVKVHSRFDKLEQQIGTILTDHEHRLKQLE